MIAEIIAIGSELLTPFRQDTNSLFLTGKLNELGVSVAFKTVVGDQRPHLVSVARIALHRADVIIFIGGLGPTEDDVTRESVSEAMRLPLKRDPDIVAELYARFAARRIKMPDNNARQADVLTGAVSLYNKNGTAPGQYLEGEFEGKLKIVMLLPGPPYELKPMFVEQCLPRLRLKLPVHHIATRVLKVAMMPESECDARIGPIYKEHNAVQTTILAHAGEVQIHLKAEADSMEEAQDLVNALAEELEDELDERIYSTKGERLEQIVGYYLQMRNATLAVAESCTGGKLADRLTSVPGSSRYFLGGAIVYANELKSSFASVPPQLIEEHGAVSKEVAIAMAEGIRAECDATIGVGITGVAGPGGGTEEKPVGLVYVAVTDGKRPEVIERKFGGDRERIRQFATQLALDMVRRRLM
jgi:nicotinamide-nucleotide amidase